MSALCVSTGSSSDRIKVRLEKREDSLYSKKPLDPVATAPGTDTQRLNRINPHARLAFELK